MHLFTFKHHCWFVFIGRQYAFAAVLKKIFSQYLVSKSRVHFPTHSVLGALTLKIYIQELFYNCGTGLVSSVLCPAFPVPVFWAVSLVTRVKNSFELKPATSLLGVVLVQRFYNERILLLQYVDIAVDNFALSSYRWEMESLCPMILPRLKHKIELAPFLFVLLIEPSKPPNTVEVRNSTPQNINNVDCRKIITELFQMSVLQCCVSFMGSKLNRRVGVLEVFEETSVFHCAWMKLPFLNFSLCTLFIDMRVSETLLLMKHWNWLSMLIQNYFCCWGWAK